MTDSPVMYRTHPKVPPGATCEGCGGNARVTDHCHAHGWVRGQVCTRRNGLMGIIDRRIAPRVEMILIDSLLALWHRCPDCSRDGTIELGPGVCELSIPGCSSAVRASELRVNLRDTLNAVDRGEHVQIKRYDDETAVIVPVDWYRNMLAIKRGVHAFTHDTDGNWLPGKSELPVGELLSAIGEAAISELEK